ncbi:MAG: helix-turn-helix domain-containing protein [Azospira sp.]|jgi:transcriptional regulator GlxA family with amidase domain|nr:helix-turn-helix domain-containing protein [Azospira sp.]
MGASAVVAVLAFDRISPFHLSVPCVVFGERHPDLPACELRVCGIEPGPIRTTAGFSVLPEHGLAALAEADTVIVPSWRDVNETPPAALLQALNEAHQRGARIVGLCLGAYVLAAAGLLDGRRATTHWAWAEDFARRYPDAIVQPDVLYVEDGRVLTSAGTAAGIDCCLHMVRQAHGVTVANSVARRLVVAPHRQGGQAQFVSQPVPASAGGDRLSGLLDWLRGHLDEAYTLDSLAELALLSRRSLTRHFRQQTGMSPGQWLLAERLAFSQRLLETGTQPIEEISRRAGFGSPKSLRLHFRQAFGVSPSAWRRSFARPS